MKQHKVQLAPGMPAMDPAQFAWVCIGDENTRKKIFDVMEKNNRSLKKADLLICNTTNVLEEATLNSFPEILPIGPLLARNRLGKAIGCLWSEDSDCLAWLDEQPPQSVIYVAFGSFTIFDQIQFHELAVGLELTNRPFLWVVRPESTEETDYNDAYPNPNPNQTGLGSKTLGHGRLVSWAPQQDVLKHPSVACFLSHCGWNSTMEGISNGLPFLCWPYFADQFLNRSYICDIWKVGLGFNPNKKGIIERGEIKNKVDQLFSSDAKFRERALELKSSILEEKEDWSSSCKNFIDLINWIKSQKN